MTDASTLAHYNETLAVADHHGQHWTLADLELVDETREIPAAEVAATLGRTLYAVWTARSMTRDEIREARERAAQTPRETRPVLPYDRGFTDIEALFA